MGTGLTKVLPSWDRLAMLGTLKTQCSCYLGCRAIRGDRITGYRCCTAGTRVAGGERPGHDGRTGGDRQRLAHTVEGRRSRRRTAALGALLRAVGAAGP